MNFRTVNVKYFKVAHAERRAHGLNKGFSKKIPQ